MLDKNSILSLREKHLSTSLSLSYAEPLHIIRGEGQYLYEANGKQYLDAVNNIQHVGHCHPKVVEAAHRQYKRLNTNTRYLDESIVNYAKALTDKLPPGLDENIITQISSMKKEPEWLLKWRLKAYQHWGKMEEPRHWPQITYPNINYQDIIYFSRPKKKYTSLEEVPQEILDDFEKLGVPLREREKLAGVAVDAVFDSVSLGTTFANKLEELGIIFCSFSEAVEKHPELIKKYLGSVVPPGDNYFAALNSAVFSDGSFAYIPKNTKCPMELSTYFRINSEDTGQFERTLIIADEGTYVSYLEGCTAPMRDENQLHAAIVE